MNSEKEYTYNKDLYLGCLILVLFQNKKVKYNENEFAYKLINTLHFKSNFNLSKSAAYKILICNRNHDDIKQNEINEFEFLIIFNYFLWIM